MKMEDRGIRIANKILDGILTVFFCLVISVGFYIMIDAKQVYLQAEQYQLSHRKPELPAEEVLKEISGNAIGRITIDDTPVDYPVLQSDNNLEYLSKDPDGNYSMAGSIFLDFRNKPDFTDPYNIIYGHHMPDGLMFGALDAFADPSYFASHRRGTLFLKGRELAFYTSAFLIVRADIPEIFEPGYQRDFSQFLSEHALQFDPGSLTGHFLALTTCTEQGDSNREVLLISLK